MLLRSRAFFRTFLSSTVLAVSTSFVQAQTSPRAVDAPPRRLAEVSVEAPQEQDPLLQQVNEAIRLNGQRYLTANYHSPWQIFHGMLAYRQDFLLKVGDQKMSAIEWISTADPKFDNLPLFLVTQQGVKFHPYTRPYAFEGHPSQTLALLSESHLPPDHQFQASGQKVTITQLLQSTMLDVNTREETTWVLWALINYYDVDTQWTNRYGQAWSMEALVRNEVAAHTPTRPCGGNHNLFALCRARDRYLQTGRPLRGVWFEADQKIRQYIEYARSMQNSDGTFSSNFYKGPGHSTDMNTRFNTTGHTLEFLSVALPTERLQEPWVRNAVNMLSRELITHRKASVDCGPLYHSLNALKIYRDRLRPPSVEVVVKDPVELLPMPSATTAAKPAIEMPANAPAAVTSTDADRKPADATPPVSQPRASSKMPEKPVDSNSSAVDSTAPQLPVDFGGPGGPASALTPINQ